MCKQNMIQKKGKIIMNGQIICVSVIAVLLVLIGFITSGSIMKRTSDEGMAEFGMFLSCLIMIPCIIFSCIYGACNCKRSRHGKQY